jgi:hypothetical protein
VHAARSRPAAARSPAARRRQTGASDGMIQQTIAASGPVRGKRFCVDCLASFSYLARLGADRAGRPRRRPPGTGTSTGRTCEAQGVSGGPSSGSAGGCGGRQSETGTGGGRRHPRRVLMDTLRRSAGSATATWSSSTARDGGQGAGRGHQQRRRAAERAAEPATQGVKVLLVAPHNA